MEIEGAMKETLPVVTPRESEALLSAIDEYLPDSAEGEAERQLTEAVDQVMRGQILQPQPAPPPHFMRAVPLAKALSRAVWDPSATTTSADFYSLSEEAERVTFMVRHHFESEERLPT